MKDRCKDYCGNYDVCCENNDFVKKEDMCPHFIFDMLDSFTKEERDIIQQKILNGTLFSTNDH